MNRHYCLLCPSHRTMRSEQSAPNRNMTVRQQITEKALNFVFFLFCFIELWDISFIFQSYSAHAWARSVLLNGWFMFRTKPHCLRVFGHFENNIVLVIGYWNFCPRHFDGDFFLVHSILWQLYWEWQQKRTEQVIVLWKFAVPFKGLFRRKSYGLFGFNDLFSSLDSFRWWKIDFHCRITTCASWLSKSHHWLIKAPCFDRRHPQNTKGELFRQQKTPWKISRDSPSARMILDPTHAQF